MKPGRQCRAFTLVELMISSAVSAIILAGFIWGVTCLQRSFTAADFYATAQSDETRVLDYVTRDVRRALTLSATNSTLTLTVPNYIDSSTGAPRLPSISNSNSILYTATGTTIAYTLSGSRVTRTEGAGTALVIASNVTAFTPVLDVSDTTGNTIQTTLTFSPNFQTSVSSIATAGTTIVSKATRRY